MIQNEAVQGDDCQYLQSTSHRHQSSQERAEDLLQKIAAEQDEREKDLKKVENELKWT